MRGEEIAPFMLGALMFMIPIIAILAHHQRKMAELIHGRSQQLPPQADPALIHEIARLREIVAQQSIAIDNLAQTQKKLESRMVEADGIRQRLES